MVCTRFIAPGYVSLGRMAGDESKTPRDRILFLARAQSRVQILEHLMTVESATQHELRTNLEASRTTISRALNSLTDEGWVAQSDGAYQLTPVGRIVATAFADLLDTMKAAEELSSFLHWFPADVDAPDFIDADDVTVTTSTESDPYAPARRQTEVLNTADSLRLLLPAVDLESTETLTEQVTNRGLEVESIVSLDVESTLESDAFASLMRENAETGRSTVLVADQQPPFYLGLANGSRTQIGLADDEGIPRALLETTDREVWEWANGVYQECRDRAREKSFEEF